MTPRTIRTGILVALALALASPASASALPGGFQTTNAFAGLDGPMAVRFAPNGHVFVAEKRGIIKAFSGLSDTTPTTVADLRTETYNYWDRGMMGLAVDPGYPASPYIYVIYSRDADIGGAAPKWGQAGETDDPCPDPPGDTKQGCVTSGRVARLKVDPATDQIVGSPVPLVDGWCGQFPSHSMGDLLFGPDGELYASGGDGASFNYADYGQTGNPCGDPPFPAGVSLIAPLAEGGALRSQDLRTSSPLDPAGLNGTIIRIDPATGAAWPANPGAGSSDVNVRRIVTYGLRQPFRFTRRPGTEELWIGEVGWNTWEEIDRDALSPTKVHNFGWPCYEGPSRMPAYDQADLNICENLYADSGAVTAPYFTYRHGSDVVPGEPCANGSSSISGIAFSPPSGPYPDAYDDALFFADYSRNCIWVMPAGANGLPDPVQTFTFSSVDPLPVDLTVGPTGELFYADIGAGTIVRVRYVTPHAVATATSPTSGDVPLEVSFDGTGSTDRNNAPLTYAWDLDGDGEYDDSGSPTPTHTYDAGTTSVRLRVSNDLGESNVSDPIAIHAGNTPPTATIATPASSLRWSAGDTVVFSGSGTDFQDGTLDETNMHWDLNVQHCPSDCHTHYVRSWSGKPGDSFSAPDHQYPSHLELTLTVTDSGGLTDTETVSLDPNTVHLTAASSPPGRTVALNGNVAPAPLTATVIANSNNSVSASSPQSDGTATFFFEGWSDGGGQSHNLSAGTADSTLTATFRPDGVAAPGSGGFATPPAADPSFKSDRKAPALRSLALSPQWPLRSGTLRAWVTCTSERCRVSLRTSFATSGSRRRTYRLATPARWFARGRRHLLVLKLSPAFRQALARRLRRGGVQPLSLTVRASDAAGNTVVRTIRIAARR
jgi:glucose/arabinose dehydrogenase